MNGEWLDMLKDGLNIDFTEKDRELEQLLRVSEEHCLRETNRTEEDLREEGRGEYPLPFVHAVVLLARHLFETGGTMVPATMKENPMGFRLLLNQFYRPI